MLESFLHSYDNVLPESTPGTLVPVRSLTTHFPRLKMPNDFMRYIVVCFCMQNYFVDKQFRVSSSRKRDSCKNMFWNSRGKMFATNMRISFFWMLQFYTCSKYLLITCVDAEPAGNVRNTQLTFLLNPNRNIFIFVFGSIRSSLFIYM